ncbi:MAG: hypothetical protein ABMA64_30300 [Myxococcota bacterium]
MPRSAAPGPLDRWSTTTAALVAQGRLTADDHREVRWREVFGDLVANTDMHANNLPLWLDDLALAGSRRRTGQRSPTTARCRAWRAVARDNHPRGVGLGPGIGRLPR